jgi:hypothetical protein
MLNATAQATKDLEIKGVRRNPDRVVWSRDDEGWIAETTVTHTLKLRLSRSQFSEENQMAVETALLGMAHGLDDISVKFIADLVNVTNSVVQQLKG